MDQFNSIAVDDREESRLRQETLTPALMHPQSALQAGAFGQTSEQSVVIPLQPAVKSSKVATFEREQQPDSNQLARVQAGLGMFGYSSHSVIYPAEQFNDKVFGGHGSYLQRFGDYWLYESRDLVSTSTIG